MREAAVLAEKLWSHPGTTIGIVQRRKKSSRFLVGMAYLDGTKAVTLGSSNVDWESAFTNAALAGHCSMEPEFDGNQTDPVIK